MHITVYMSFQSRDGHICPSSPVRVNGFMAFEAKIYVKNIYLLVSFIFKFTEPVERIYSNVTEV